MGERGGEFSVINCRATAISVESINVCARVCIVSHCVHQICVLMHERTISNILRKGTVSVYFQHQYHIDAPQANTKKMPSMECVLLFAGCLYHILISHPFMGKGSAGSTTNGGCGGGGGGMEKLGILLNSNKNGMIRSNKRTKQLGFISQLQSTRA